MLALALIATSAFSATAASAAVVHEINPTGASAATWGATEVGWFYTPDTSYTLTAIGTKFGSSDGRTVTAEFYSGAPGALTLLRSGTLVPIANAFADAVLAPLNLTAGMTYFFGFTNVGGLDTNVTDDAGATNLAGGLMYSFGSGAYENGPETHFTAQPMVRFSGDLGSAVPEPATWAMMIVGFGLAGSAVRSRRRQDALAFA
ncbi:MAG: PEPxxWA-CTERM sorting domain-containing protein [Phenylobacterium sp.]|nr:PEPxxWA-CTERM sorting domain-containing protein [Phenylobacterium sp.]MDP3855074.1 PEPxxWA-CTERM sorting domain-containing protein [Phenylobacterium sp.]